MKLFWKKAPSPAGSAVDLSPQGEVKGRMTSRSDTSPFGGEVAAKRRVRGPSSQPDHAFNQNNCAIWNDIRRALEAK